MSGMDPGGGKNTSKLLARKWQVHSEKKLTYLSIT